MTTPRKKKITQKILSSLNKLKVFYYLQYGDASYWSDDLCSIFLLNCDIEIESIASKDNCDISKKLLDSGLSYTIMGIQTEITFDYMQKFMLDPTDMPNTIKKMLLEDTVQGVLNFMADEVWFNDENSLLQCVSGSGDSNLYMGIS